MKRLPSNGAVVHIDHFNTVETGYGLVATKPETERQNWTEILLEKKLIEWHITLKNKFNNL
jgi:hypothetical protein